jgi:hypothetical protein
MIPRSLADRGRNDPSWMDLCERYQVLLVWPESWSHQLIEGERRSQH